MHDLFSAYIFAMPSSFGDSPAYGSEAAFGVPLQHRDTNCLCSHWMPDLLAAFIFAMHSSLGDSPAYGSEAVFGFFYSTEASRPVEQLPVEAQLPPIWWDVRFMQDLLVHQHNQLRAQEILSGLLGSHAAQLKHSLSRSLIQPLMP